LWHYQCRAKGDSGVRRWKKFGLAVLGAIMAALPLGGVMAESDPYLAQIDSYFVEQCTAGSGQLCNSVATRLEQISPADRPISLPFWERPCQLKDGYSCMRASGYYAFGSYGTVKDQARAEALDQSGCALGFASSCYNLGQMKSKAGVNAEAMSYFAKACATSAPTNLGCEEAGTPREDTYMASIRQRPDASDAECQSAFSEMNTAIDTYNQDTELATQQLQYAISFSEAARKKESVRIAIMMDTNRDRACRKIERKLSAISYHSCDKAVVDQFHDFALYLYRERVKSETNAGESECQIGFRQ